MEKYQFVIFAAFMINVVIVFEYTRTEAANVSLIATYGFNSHAVRVKRHDTGVPSADTTRIERKKNEHVKRLRLSSSEIQELERRTADPANNKEWKKEKLARLTDFHFGKICNLRKKDDKNSTVSCILYRSPTISGSDPTRYGNQMELNIAITEFEKRYGLQVLRSGVFVDLHLPYLAATPDGLVGDDSIIRITCPYFAKDFTPIDALKHDKLKYEYVEIKSGTLVLKKRHDLYYQVQGQLHITKRKFCYFVIWTPKGMSVEKIERDDKFWENNMESSLKKFYMDNLLPEIINPQHSPYKNN